MTKKKLLNILQHHTYCRLKGSKIHGVGVFAVKDIPKGINPFKGVKRGTWFRFTESELSHVHPEILKIIDDFCPAQDGKILIPDHGLNGMDISFYMNTTRKPNMRSTDNGESFVSVKKIKAGRELTVDYTTFSEEE